MSDRPTLLGDLREMVREVVDYRELLRMMVRRDLILRYKQTIMGVGWAVAMPVLNMLVFSVIFTRVAPLDTGLPYPLFAYAGLLPWNFFQSSLRFAALSLVGNSPLVTKVYFPRELLPFAAVAVGLVDLLVGATVLAGLMIYYGVGVGSTIAFIPIILLVQVAFTAGVALVLAMANLFYRDVKYLFEVVILVWMFSTSVVYPVERIGGTLGALLALNPMTPIIDSYRAVLLRGTAPQLGPLAYAAVVAVTVLMVTWVAFHRREPLFAENL